MNKFKQVTMEQAKFGTSLKGYITVSYPQIMSVLGEPEESDGYKVSGEWVFQDDEGDEFTIYDWKLTDLYGSARMPVEELRKSARVQLNVGGSNVAKFLNFVTYLKGRGVLITEPRTSVEEFERRKKLFGV